MRSRRVLALLLASFIATLGLNIAPRAEEGFWPYNAVPKAAIKQKYGFDVTDEWLKHLQLSSVRFGGASGSVVSPDGLVITNHHVGLDAIQRLSTAEKDYVKNGFLAVSREDELKAPGMSLTILQSIDDVTNAVDAAARPEMPPADAFAARRAAIARIERESQEKTGLRSEVVTLYQGARYHLYRYKVYQDVRLVFAPEYQTAFFGGDPDNFEYPRYCLEITMFRLYEDGKPARTENYLRWSPNGTREGDLVFTSGHPGSTQRLYTVAHLEYLRDSAVPFNIKSLERRQALLKKYGALGAEQTRQAKDELFGIENSLKSARGQLRGLQDRALLAKKGEAERRLRSAVEADPAKRKAYGDAWDAIAASRKVLMTIDKDRSFTEAAAGLNTRLFGVARNLVRIAAESGKPDPERLPEYSDARRKQLQDTLLTPAPFHVEMEKAKLADSLAYMTQELGSDHPIVKKILGSKTPEARAAELLDGTRLADIAARKELLAGGAPAIQASNDSLIILARDIDPESRQLRKKYEDEVTSVERASYAKIAQAVFATEGANAYPDATGTLRLSYGSVKSYVEGGKQLAPYTTLGGMYQHAAAHGNKGPYELPARWNENKGALDLNTPLDFVTTNDIVGGNSGSPVVNAKGEFVGIVFDGNIHMLSGYYVYDMVVNRGIMTDSRAIIEALRKVYGAGALADEIVGAAK